VRGDGAHPDLQQHQADDGEEVLASRLHRRCGLGAQKRVRSRQLGFFLVLVATVQPQHRSDAGQQQNDADHRPHRSRGRHGVANQRLVRPVAGVGEFGLARPVGRGSPRCPEEEGGQRLTVCLLGQRTVGHGVLVAQLGQRGVSTEQTVKVTRDLANRLCALVADRQHAGRFVVAVAPHFRADACRDRRLVGLGHGRGRLALLGFAHALESDRFLVEPVGGPVGSDVAAVTPDRAQLLSAGGHPGLLTILDLLAGEDDLAVCCDDALGDGRGGQIDLPAEVTQRPERQDEDEAEPTPQPARGFHDGCSEGCC